jgi:hypothetical protein
MDERKSSSAGRGEISRRQLLRRGALAGGSLVWAIPVVQSLAPAAYAQYARCACCYCWSGDRQNPSRDACFDNGATAFLADAGTCAEWCRSTNTSGEAYESSEYCSAATRCQCNQFGQAQPQGCTCF